jgi:glycosyltransferase involved in cell wall biosynthesis
MSRHGHQCMKIAIVYASFYTRGGAENTILWLTAELLRRGHQITIFTSEYDHADHDIPEVVRQCMIEISAGGNYSTFIDWLFAGWRLRNILNTFDLVNPHNFPANVWVYFAKRFSRTFPPILWYCQEPPRTLYEPEQHRQQGRYASFKGHVRTKYRQQGIKIIPKMFQKGLFYALTTCFRQPLRRFHIRLDQQAVHACDRILGNSQYTAAVIQATYNDRALPCLLGIPKPDTMQLPARERKNYFLTVSRLEPPKRVNAILHAMRVIVHEQGQNDAVLVIVGTGTQEAALQELVKTLKLQAHVTFTGYVSDTELTQYYREALAVIYVPEAEPFGLAPLEAMRHQTAVIVSNTGGPAETVIDQTTGIHVEAGNVEQLAAAMSTLLHNRPLAIEMGRNGYEHVMRSFTFSSFVDRFEAYAAALIHGGR